MDNENNQTQEQEEVTGIKISEFPAATALSESDTVTGLQAGGNVRFTMSSILSWIALKLSNAFVSASRTINGKSLSSDVTLTATDVGARPNAWTPSAADVGAIPETAAGEPLGIAELGSDGKVPSSQLPAIPSQPSDIGAQEEITASGILKGDGAGGVSAATAGTDYQAPLTFDNTPTVNSANPVQSGGVYTDVRTRVPVNGMGKNLLRNWYFVGGGTGRGVFPVNQRGNSTYSLNGYTIDGWNSAHNSNFGSVTLTASGLVLAHPQATGNTRIEQHTGLPSGGYAMLSILTAADLYYQKVALFTSSGAYAFGNIGVTLPPNTDVIRFTVYGNTSETIKAVKLELGEEQTLAHQENGAWVLNEIPDYEYELYRCMTSTADSSDTLANKSLATEQQIAYVESGITASRAYAVGECFCWDGLLYRVTSAISSGGTFTPGTNCVQTTVMDEIIRLT